MSESQDAGMVVVRRACAILAEHFENVQIFASRRNGENTENVHYGSGDWFARYGLARAWLVQNDNNMELNNADPEKDFK